MHHWRDRHLIKAFQLPKRLWQLLVKRSKGIDQEHSAWIRTSFMDLHQWSGKVSQWHHLPKRSTCSHPLKRAWCLLRRIFLQLLLSEWYRYLWTIKPSIATLALHPRRRNLWRQHRREESKEWLSISKIRGKNWLVSWIRDKIGSISSKLN